MKGIRTVIVSPINGNRNLSQCNQIFHKYELLFPRLKILPPKPPGKATCFLDKTIRDLKIRRRRRQRERHKSNRFKKQNNNFARTSHFFVHFFAVFARLRCENAKIHVLDKT